MLTEPTLVRAVAQEMFALTLDPSLDINEAAADVIRLCRDKDLEKQDVPRNCATCHDLCVPKTYAPCNNCSDFNLWRPEGIAKETEICVA